MSGGAVKNYINLQDLTSFERGLLELANTETEGVIYAPTDQGSASEPPSFEPLPNAEILSEDEIRSFMKNPAFVLPDDRDSAFDILKSRVPHVYYDEIFRQRSSISLERVQRASKRLREKVDEIRGCASDKSQWPCDSSFFPLNYYQIDVDRRFEQPWLDTFGNDAVLAFGLFEAAQSRAFQRYGSRRENWKVSNFNHVYPKFLLELEAALADPALQRRFVSPEIPDPLGTLVAPGPELSDGADRTVVRQRHYAYWNLILQLENYVGDTRTPVERTEQLRDSSGFLASVDELELPAALKAKVRSLAQALKGARRVDDPHFRQVIRLQAEIAEKTARNGFYFRLTPTFQARDYEYADVGLIEAGTILGWALLKGHVVHQEDYKTASGVRTVYFLDRFLDRESEALLDEAKGNSFMITKRSGVDTASLVRSYHFGETKAEPGTNSIIVNDEATRAHLERFENAFGPSRLGTVMLADDWVGPLWKGLRGRYSMEQLIGLSANSTAGHELEHAWRAAAGLPVHEESAMYGNIDFAGHPYEALVLLFLSQTNSGEYLRQFSGRSPFVPLGFNSNGNGGLASHSRAVKELLISLALQYGVEGPYDNEGLAWVKTLFEKIRSATAHPDVNDSLLRRRIAVAYRERFGLELKPVAQLRPLVEIKFKD